MDQSGNERPGCATIILDQRSSCGWVKDQRNYGDFGEKTLSFGGFANQNISIRICGVLLMSVCLSTIASTISRFLFCTSKSKNGYLVWDSVLYNLTFQTDSEYRGDQTAWIITTSLVFYAVLTTPKWLSLSNTVIESTSLLTSVFVFVFLYEVPSM